MRTGSPKSLSHGSNASWDTSGILLDEALLEAQRPLDLAEVFGNTRPVELEIGSGKGTFLLARAAARPELNFLGLEWAKAYCTYAADRIRRAGLLNVRMARAEAAMFVRKSLSDRSLWRVHIYFPDPWPKRRHHRRRLIQPAFISQLRRKLTLGGQVIVVTDHLDYFHQIRAVLDRCDGLASIDLPRMAARDGELVGTNFERKYIAQGRAFYSTAKMRYT